jgi:hypothetical protein
LLGSSLEGASGSLYIDLWPVLEDDMGPEIDDEGSEEAGAEMLSGFLDSRREK